MVIIALLVAALSFLLLTLIGAFSGSSPMSAAQPTVAPLDDPHSFSQLMADLMWTK